MYKKGINVQIKYKSEWKAWINARRRCSDKKNPYYKWYGGSGIFVCKEWQHNFMSFLSNVGVKPSNNLTLDRIDNSKGYEPGNCRWVDMKTQCNNRRPNKGGYHFSRGTVKYKDKRCKHCDSIFKPTGSYNLYCCNCRQYSKHRYRSI